MRRRGREGAGGCLGCRRGVEMEQEGAGGVLWPHEGAVGRKGLEHLRSRLAW